MMMHAFMFLIGAMTGSLLGGAIPYFAERSRTSREEDEELAEFMGFIGHENESRSNGGAGYWWNPTLEEKNKYAILSRLVSKGLLIYQPGSGFALKDHLLYIS